MFVIDVIPFASGLPAGTLSYRSKNRLEPGTLVFVPLRSKRIPALVLTTSSVMEAKAQLKSAGFALRGGTLTTAGVLPKPLLAAAETIAAYHTTSIGHVFGTLLKDVLPDSLPKDFSRGSGYRRILVEDTYEKRIVAYRALVEQKSPHGTVLMVAPTVVEAERLVHIFKKEGATLLTGTLRGKRRITALAAAQRAHILVTTPSFAWLPIEKLSVIILERPSAHGFFLQKRPYMDMRIAADALAEARALPVVYGDLPLPLEFRPEPSAVLNIHVSTPVRLIDARTEEKETRFQALPTALRDAVMSTHEAGGRVALLTVRKGYGSAVICRDCGSAVKDERGAMLSFVTVGDKRLFRSADGYTTRDADVWCTVCKSWNLYPLGIGVERVIAEVKKALPSADVIRFDTDVITTSAHARSALTRMQEKGAVVVGTEIMLPYLEPQHPFELAAIVSADSLLALPFWRARERVVRLGLTLRERAHQFMIATRLPEESALSAITHPEKTAFFREESDIRAALLYPPFGHILVFHTEGTKAKVDEAARLIEDAVLPLIPMRLNDRMVARGRTRLSLVVKVPRDTWPSSPLLARLRQLPFWISVHLDSESFW